MEKVSESINHNCNHFHPEIKQSKSHTIQPSTGLVRMYLLMKIPIKNHSPMCWWFEPIWKILVKLDHFPKWGWKQKMFELPPPSSLGSAPSCLSTYSALKAVRKRRANSSSTGPEAKVVGFFQWCADSPIPSEDENGEVGLPTAITHEKKGTFWAFHQPNLHDFCKMLIFASGVY